MCVQSSGMPALRVNRKDRQNAKPPVIELPLLLFELLTEQVVVYRTPDGDRDEMKSWETPQVLLHFHEQPEGPKIPIPQVWPAENHGELLSRHFGKCPQGFAVGGQSSPLPRLPDLGHGVVALRPLDKCLQFPLRIREMRVEILRKSLYFSTS